MVLGCRRDAAKEAGSVGIIFMPIPRTHQTDIESQCSERVTRGRLTQ